MSRMLVAECRPKAGFRKLSERAFGPPNFMKMRQSQYAQRPGAARAKKQWIS